MACVYYHHLRFFRFQLSFLGADWARALLPILQEKLEIFSTSKGELHGCDQAVLAPLQQYDVQSAQQEQAVHLAMHVQCNCLVIQLAATAEVMGKKKLQLGQSLTEHSVIYASVMD